MTPHPNSRALTRKLSAINFFRFHATKAIAETAEGRAYLLHQLADAEGGNGGELQIFDHLLEYVQDPKLRQIMTLHKEDEERHEQIYRECAAAQGVTNPPRRSTEGNLLNRLDDKVQFFSQPVSSDNHVFEAYLLLWVIEERAATQFSQMRRVFEAVGDQATADVFSDIEADEIRHLKYCQAVTKKYAPSEAVRQERLAHYRALEAEAFFHEGQASMRDALDKGLITGWRRLMWSSVLRLAQNQNDYIPAYVELSAAAA